MDAWLQIYLGIGGLVGFGFWAVTEKNLLHFFEGLLLIALWPIFVILIGIGMLFHDTGAGHF